MPDIATALEGKRIAIDTFANGSGGSVDTFRSEQEKFTVTVQEGKLVEIDIIKQFYDEEYSRAAIYNDSSTPYMVYQLPDAPGQNWSSEFKSSDGLPPEFLLAPDEAIVYLGKNTAHHYLVQLPQLSEQKVFPGDQPLPPHLCQPWRYLQHYEHFLDGHA